MDVKSNNWASVNRIGNMSSILSIMSSAGQASLLNKVTVRCGQHFRGLLFLVSLSTLLQHHSLEFEYRANADISEYSTSHPSTFAFSRLTTSFFVLLQKLEWINRGRSRRLSLAELPVSVNVNFRAEKWASFHLRKFCPWDNVPKETPIWG